MKQKIEQQIDLCVQIRMAIAVMLCFLRELYWNHAYLVGSCDHRAMHDTAEEESCGTVRMTV